MKYTLLATVMAATPATAQEMTFEDLFFLGYVDGTVLNCYLDISETKHLGMTQADMDDLIDRVSYAMEEGHPNIHLAEAAILSGANAAKEASYVACKEAGELYQEQIVPNYPTWNEAE